MFPRQLILKSSLEFYKSTNIRLCVHNPQLYNLLITFQCIRPINNFHDDNRVTIKIQFQTNVLILLLETWNNVFVGLSFEGKGKIFIDFTFKGSNRIGPIIFTVDNPNLVRL